MSVVKAINTRAKSSAALSNTLDYIYKDKKVTEELKLVTGDYFEEKVTADVKKARENAEKYALRWQSVIPKNFTASPGGLTQREAAEILALI